jgi:hypothetical protein
MVLLDAMLYSRCRSFPRGPLVSFFILRPTSKTISVCQEAYMSEEKSNAGQSGGVNISGGNVTAANIVGGNMTVGTQVSPVQLQQAFQPVADYIRANAGANEAAATQKLEELRNEASKGKDAKDTVLAKVIEGLVGLVPGAVSAVVSAFGTPLLGGIAGPATKYVLDKIQGK